MILFVMRSAVGAMPASGVARSVRSSLFAGSAVSLSLIAHVAGGGAAPPAFLVVALVLLMSAAASLLAGRQRGQLGIGTLLLLTQVSLHEVFAFFSSGPAGKVATEVRGQHAALAVHAGMNSMTGMSMGLAGGGGQGAAAATDGAMAGMTQPMLIWHALAALVLAIL